jgi:thymidylate synthase (FAD)
LRINISGGGFVELVNVNGTDAGIDTVARVEFEATEPRMPDTVDDLLCYMIRHAHTSPFEFVNMTFKIRCPMFVQGQIKRHRTAHLSEISGRYKDVATLGAYAPPRDHLRQKAPNRKQGSADTLVEYPEEVLSKISEHYQNGLALYRYLTEEAQLSNENARMVLSQSNFTHSYFQLDLHNILNFIRLRIHGTSQFQTNEYAEAIAHFVGQAFPITYRNFVNHVLKAVRFSHDELAFLKIDEEALKQAKYRLRKGRYNELLEKVEAIRAARQE